MKFLIQTIDNQIVDDFSFTLIEAIKYHKFWGNTDMEYITHEGVENFDNLTNENYCPIGTVEFVHNFYSSKFKDDIQKYLPPLTIPKELTNHKYLKRDMWEMYISKNEIEKIKETFKNKNWTLKDGIMIFKDKKYFFKERSKVKGYINICKIDELQEGDYIVSQLIDIDSEWRCFVYQNKLVGLQNYCGDFTIFPNVDLINECINTFSETNNAPISYTLDVGVNSLDGTFIIELHNFYSCGLYGFSDLQILPYMFFRWHNNFINQLKQNKNFLNKIK